MVAVLVPFIVTVTSLRGLLSSPESTTPVFCAMEESGNSKNSRKAILDRNFVIIAILGEIKLVLFTYISQKYTIY